MKVAVGTSSDVAAMTTTLVNHVSFAGNATTESTIFTVNESGVYYFGFHGYGGASGTLYLDDIVVEAYLSNGSVEIDNLNYFPNPVKDILHIDYSETVDAIQVYTLLGQEVYSTTNSAKTSQIDMATFAAGTYLVRVTSGQNVKNIKVIKL